MIARVSAGVTRVCAWCVCGAGAGRGGGAVRGAGAHGQGVRGGHGGHGRARVRRARPPAPPDHERAAVLCSTSWRYALTHSHSPPLASRCAPPLL